MISIVTGAVAGIAFVCGGLYQQYKSKGGPMDLPATKEALETANKKNKELQEELTNYRRWYVEISSGAKLVADERDRFKVMAESHKDVQWRDPPEPRMVALVEIAVDERLASRALGRAPLASSEGVRKSSVEVKTSEGT